MKKNNNHYFKQKFSNTFLIVLLFVFQHQAISSPLSDQQTIRSHGFALYGDLKYQKDFPHFDYVNPDAPKGGKISLMATGTFDTLNPYTMKGISPFNSPGTFLYGFGELTDTLLAGTSAPHKSGDEPYSAYGLIAESVEYPKDKSWVIFHLRDSAEFQDGHKIDADDVAFSYETLKEKGHPRFSIQLKQTKSVEVLSKKSVKVVFNHPHSGSGILRFGELPILPEHYWQNRDFEKTTMEAPLVSGPYQIDKIQAGQRISFKRVQSYWGSDLGINKGRFNFDEVTIDFYRDLTVAFEAFKSGEFDIYLEYMSKNWATGYQFPALENGNIIKREIPHSIPSGTQGFFFNTRKAIFADAKVREALSSVFDFDWSNANLFYKAYKRSTSFYPNSPYSAEGKPTKSEKDLLVKFKDYLPEAVFTEEYPLAVHQPNHKVTRKTFKKAIKLLAEAGWRIKDGKLKNEAGNTFKFEFLIRQKGLERIILPYGKNLKKLGIETSLRLVDSSQYKVRIDNFDFDVTTFVLGQGLAPGNEQFNYFHSNTSELSGSQNLSGISHPAIDALTEKVMTAETPYELTVTMKALDRVLLSGHYIVPHWHIDYHRVAYKNHFGLPEKQPDFALGFENWWIKPSR